MCTKTTTSTIDVWRCGEETRWWLLRLLLLMLWLLLMSELLLLPLLPSVLMILLLPLLLERLAVFLRRGFSQSVRESASRSLSAARLALACLGSLPWPLGTLGPSLHAGPL